MTETERGSLLLEVLIAGAIVAISGIALLTYAVTTTKAAARNQRLLLPQCARPVCRQLSQVNKCACGHQNLTVLR